MIEMSQKHLTQNRVEERFIRALARKLSISYDDLEGLLSGELVIQYRPPKNEYERIFQFQALVFLALSDGLMEADEHDFLHNAGLRMGIRHEVSESVINLSRKFYPEPVPLEKLKQQYSLFKS